MSNQVSLSLNPNQNDLWKMFHSEVNEMIVTKAGRNFFPKLEYIVNGLDPNKLYAVMVQMKIVDDYRYKFSNGQWIQSGKGDSQSEIKKSWHADGVRTGKEWMERPICFERVKITNDLKATDACMIPLHSMHKYAPVLTIFEAPSENPFVATSSDQIVISKSIPHTEFIAVTAYQNQKIIDLKIKFNAYAKGFRKEKPENDRKRRAPSVTDYSTDESNSKSSSPKTKYSRANSSSPPDSSFSSIPSTINPFLFTFPNFSPLTPPPSMQSLPFSFPFFQFLNPLSIPIPSESIKKQEEQGEEPKDSEEEIDIIH